MTPLVGTLVRLSSTRLRATPDTCADGIPIYPDEDVIGVYICSDDGSSSGIEMHLMLTERGMGWVAIDSRQFVHVR